MKTMIGWALVTAGVLFFAAVLHTPALMASKWLTVVGLGISAAVIRIGIGLVFGFHGSERRSCQ